MAQMSSASTLKSEQSMWFFTSIAMPPPLAWMGLSLLAARVYPSMEKSVETVGLVSLRHMMSTWLSLR